MVDFLSPGTKTQQVRKGPVVVPGINTAIGGFLVYTPKGPIGRAIKVTSVEDAAEVFGSRQHSLPGVSRLADTLKDFFEDGGASCYVIRYCGAGSVAADRDLSTPGGNTAGSLSSNNGAFPVALVPGDTFTASVNGGGAATATVNAARATKTGVGGTFAAVVSGHKLDVTIAGIPGTQSIVFTSENTIAAYLDTINDQLMGGRAVNVAGQVRIETDALGSAAAGTIAVTSDSDVLTSLGLTTGAFVAGVNNVANVNAVTATELASILDTAIAGATFTGDNTLGKLTAASDTTGSGSTFQFTTGTGVAKIAGFDTAVHTGLTNATTPSITLTAASGVHTSPGTWGNYMSTKAERVDTVVAKVAVTTAGATSQLVLSTTARVQVGDQISITKGADTQRGVVSRKNGLQITLVDPITVPGGGYLGTENVVNETFTITVYDENGLVVFPSPFRNLRMSPLAGLNYFVNVINGAPRTPVIATDLAAVVANKDARPVTDTSPVYLTGGNDGAAPLYSDVTARIADFDQADDVNHVSCPGAATDFPGTPGVAILQAMEAYGERRQDVMVIHDLPLATPALGSGGVRDYVSNTVGLSSSYSACYWPWPKRLSDETGALTAFPPSPHIQGIIARTHRRRNFGKAPAGEIDGKLSNCQDLQTIIGEGSAEYDDFYPAGVNAILKLSGVGYCVWGSRTMDTTGEFGQINQQIVFNVDKRLAKKATRFVNFENNDTSTRNNVVRVLTSLFRQQRVDGVLQGASDDDAFFVICDETNNTPSVIASGKMKVRVGLAVSRATEFLEFTFEQDTRKIDAELAAQAAV